jgi:hypothetical protein
MRRSLFGRGYFPDIFAQLGWIDFFDVRQRKKLIAVISWTVPFVWAFMYLYIELPVVMVLFGGVVGSLMLFIVVFGAYHFKYGRIQFIPSGGFYNVAFWISVISILEWGLRCGAGVVLISLSSLNIASHISII